MKGGGKGKEGEGKGGLPSQLGSLDPPVGGGGDSGGLVACDDVI